MRRARPHSGGLVWRDWLPAFWTRRQSSGPPSLQVSSPWKLPQSHAQRYPLAAAQTPSLHLSTRQKQDTVKYQDITPVCEEIKKEFSWNNTSQKTFRGHIYKEGTRCVKHQTTVYTNALANLWLKLLVSKLSQFFWSKIFKSSAWVQQS